MNWLHFAAGIMATALQMAVKNPASIAKERAILTEIRDLLNELLPPSSDLT